ncbi:phosphatidylinositol-specific phospholipase C1-like protein [Streptomyces litchfieldiae]|uniref:Phosphatidylinositol-specific phospholipase C1-like protein n=1 Tax=Streptomyces litchfieldiae TaxID=3075543 RepID=A0ABU2MW05_9ACTN|nr:phosphatidylinositol-specific phospholipase C1-like protein [Streptomyces sp. DSM 44938]MDT0345831.1 phosphatidylinositol-specific phospholipase C1-like protein [Streptomyces sp. DSM 44938]
MPRPAVCLRRTAAVLAALAAVAPALSGAAPAGSAAPEVRMNEIQAIGTHNSYHRELSFAEKAAQSATDANFWNLEYSHASLPAQFETQRVRGIELDVFADPEGGLYGRPLVRTDAGLGPLTDPELQEPGFKVLHWADHDYGTSCASLRLCLTQVEEWSDAHPDHAPIPVLLELKTTDPAREARGGAVGPDWTPALLDALDAEIRSIVPESGMVTPDDVRRPGLTLEESVLRHGWPSLGDSRGRLIFLMDNQDPALQAAYRTGRPSLEGRVLFTNSRPGRADAAFVGWNDPTGENEAVIRSMVERGYYVRTRSDVPFTEASSGTTERLRAALDSGAQIISTDFPVTGLAGRYGSDYTAELPGDTAVRCNPVNAPRSCRSSRLEDVN